MTYKISVISLFPWLWLPFKEEKNKYHDSKLALNWFHRGSHTFAQSISNDMYLFFKAELTLWLYAIVCYT